MFVAYSYLIQLSSIVLYVFGCSCSGVRRVRRVRRVRVFCWRVRCWRSGRSVRSCGACSGLFGVGALRSCSAFVLGALGVCVRAVRGWCWRVRCSVCCVRSGGWVGGWVDAHARAGWFYTERGGRAGLAPIASASPRPGFARSVEQGGACQRDRPTHVLQFFSGRNSWPHRLTEC